MEPITFDDANIIFGAQQPEYKPLPAELCDSATGQIITCWELSPEEIKRIQETGKIWLSVLTFGQPLQPVSLAVDKPDVYASDDKEL